MNRESIKYAIENDVYSEEYSAFIMNRCGGDRLICNGDMLIEAIEDGYLLGEFLDSLCAKLGV